jgi:hypothetical protein
MTSHQSGADPGVIAHATTNRPTNTPGSELQQRFEIRVRGQLGPTLLEAFPTLTAHSQGPDTMLSGPLSDQAALYGVLHQIEALGLELLEVRSQRQPLHYGRDR